MAGPRHSTLSVPGKLILMGEHAAVYGHPALVAAVDLRLMVRIEASSGEEVELDLPQLAYEGRSSWAAIEEETRRARELWERRFRSSGPTGDPETETPGVSPDQLVRLGLGEASRALGETRPGGIRLRVESDLPVGSGFGSSAALAVGVVAAYLDLRGEPLDREKLLELSLDVERRQHGTPSGVDNAAVLFGGLLWAERGPDGLDCRPLRASAHALTGFRVYHSGAPVEPTGAVVEAVRQRLDATPRVVREALRRIDESTRTLRGQLESAGPDRHRIVELIRRCGRALEDLGVVPEPVRRLFRRVEAEGGAAKISGAGSLTGPGAGSVLVYHVEPERIETWGFLAPWRRLPVHFPAAGLRIESTIGEALA